MSASHRCSVPSCHQLATASCFECERLCCERHLNTIIVNTGARSVRIRVCPDCLRRYRIDPEIEPMLTVITTRDPAHR